MLKIILHDIPVHFTDLSKDVLVYQIFKVLQLNVYK